jgi:cytochrome b involved in lipid metabolism
MNKILILIVAVILVSGGGYYFYEKNDDSGEYEYEESNYQNQDNSTSVAPTNLAKYSISEVETHKDKSSCWSVINGNVYDLTSMFGKHKGGDDNILKICGKDGTSAFSGKHGGQEKTEAVLEKLIIGQLQN